MAQVKFDIKARFRENFIQCTPKEKFCRALYMLLVAIVFIPAFPSMLIGALCDEAIEKLNDWLW